MNQVNKIYLILFFAVVINSCSENIISECEYPDSKLEPMANYTYISENVFDKTCAQAGCHEGKNTKAPMSLTKEEAYQNLVDVNSWGDPDMKRVEPGNSSRSFIMKKLNGDGVDMMPPPPEDELPRYLIDSIAAWIDNGALNN